MELKICLCTVMYSSKSLVNQDMQTDDIIFEIYHHIESHTLWVSGGFLTTMYFVYKDWLWWEFGLSREYSKYLFGSMLYSQCNCL